MAKVIVPPPYQGPTGGRGEIEVEAGSVRACIEAVDARHPGFGAQVFDARGQVHRFVKLFRNGEPLDAGSLDAPVEAGDEIEVLAAISGG